MLTPMRIKLVGIHVNDQARASEFYGDVLGFRKKHDIDLGGGLRWLTFVDGNDDVELVLEPDSNPAAKVYQKALLDQGIPATAFEVDDLDAEHRRLEAKGVTFTTAPKQQGPVRLAVFEDTCGYLIQLYQP